MSHNEYKIIKQIIKIKLSLNTLFKYQTLRNNDNATAVKGLSPTVCFNTFHSSPLTL